MNRRKFLTLSVNGCLAATALSYTSNRLWADGVAANTTTPETWVAFGDSVTEGMTYPLWLSQSLGKAGKPVPVWVNAGIGGNSTWQYLARIDRDVFAYKPQRIFFNGGVNDVLTNRTDFNANIDAIFGKIKAAGIPCVVVSTIAIGGDHLPKNPDLKRMNEYVKERADHYGFQYVDVFTPFLAGITAGKDLLLPDHIHLTEAGYNLFVSTILKTIAPGVPISTPWDPQPEPGLLPNWKVSAIETPTQTWDVQVPVTTPDSFWWKDQERRRGFVVSLRNKVPGAKGFIAQSTLHLAAATNLLIKVGGQVSELSVDGKVLPLYPTDHHWGIREGARTGELPAGDHVIQVKIADGDTFFVSTQPIAT